MFICTDLYAHVFKTFRGQRSMLGIFLSHSPLLRLFLNYVYGEVQTRETISGEQRLQIPLALGSKVESHWRAVCTLKHWAISQALLFYFIDLFIYFETWSLPEHGAHQLARMVGQGVPELFLSLLPQQWGDKCVLLHPDFIYGCSYPHAHLGCTLPISLSPQVPWFLNAHTFDMFQRIQPFTIYLQLVAINALSF